MDADPLALCGTWALSRRLQDGQPAQFGRAHGTLTITADADGATWHEDGHLAFGGHRGPFQRTLRFRRLGHGWWLTFADGRPFHAWRPGAVVVHPCRADVYRGLFRADPDETRLRVLWDVSGPGKCQRLFSRFRRVAS
jgi:hypothetical protein